MEYRPAPLHAGMTVTDEPGIYIEGQFGVRIENVLLTQPWRETDFGRFLQFETLTLCPIDTAPLDISLLTPEELRWLNDYHQLVYDRLAPHLDAPDRDWLCSATAPIAASR
jgi:Xaa-Pro aminopeptidase